MPRVNVRRTVQIVREAVGKATAPLYPVVGPSRVTQLPSERHMGLDIGAATGTPVISPVSGIVTRVQQSKRGYGTAVWVYDPSTGRELTFGHLSRELVRVGQRLFRGQQLGAIGSTGASTGPHLHFEVGAPGPQPFYGKSSEAGAVDPLAWLRGALPNTQATSGFFGTGPAVTTVAGSRGTIPQPTVSSSVKSGTSRSSTTTVTTGKDTRTAGSRGTTQAVSPAQLAASPFSFFTQGMREDVKRAGFIATGFSILVLGLLILVYSYQEPIKHALGSTAKAGAKTAAAAGSGGAALPVVAAVLPP